MPPASSAPPASAPARGRAASHLSLSTTPLSETVIEREVLPRLAAPHLHHLDLWSTGLDGRLLALLHDALHRCTGLETLILRGNALGDAAVRALLPRLPPSLSHLDLSSTSLGAPGAAAVAGLLVGGGLRVLSLADNMAVRDDGVAVLAAALPSARALTSLDLTRVGCSPRGIVLLAVARPPKLATLLVAGNAAGRAEEQMLVRAGRAPAADTRASAEEHDEFVSSFPDIDALALGEWHVDGDMGPTASGNFLYSASSGARRAVVKVFGDPALATREAAILETLGADLAPLVYHRGSLMHDGSYPFLVLERSFHACNDAAAAAHIVDRLHALDLVHTRFSPHVVHRFAATHKLVDVDHIVPVNTPVPAEALSPFYMLPASARRILAGELQITVDHRALEFALAVIIAQHYSEDDLFGDLDKDAMLAIWAGFAGAEAIDPAPVTDPRLRQRMVQGFDM